MSTVFAEEAPYLKMLPSEYIKSGRIYFGVECGEIPDGVEAIEGVKSKVD